MLFSVMKKKECLSFFLSKGEKKKKKICFSLQLYLIVNKDTVTSILWMALFLALFLHYLNRQTLYSSDLRSREPDEGELDPLKRIVLCDPT